MKKIFTTLILGFFILWNIFTWFFVEASTSYQYLTEKHFERIDNKIDAIKWNKSKYLILLINKINKIINKETNYKKKAIYSELNMYLKTKKYNIDNDNPDDIINNIFDTNEEDSDTDDWLPKIMSNVSNYYEISNFSIVDEMSIKWFSDKKLKLSSATPLSLYYNQMDYFIKTMQSHWQFTSKSCLISVDTLSDSDWITPATDWKYYFFSDNCSIISKNTNKVDWVCWSANWGTYSTDNFIPESATCKAWKTQYYMDVIYSSDAKSYIQSWNCLWQNWWSNVICKATITTVIKKDNPVNWVCWSANWGTYNSTDSFINSKLCSSWDYFNDNLLNGLLEWSYNWTCKGKNWWTNMNCRANIVNNKSTTILWVTEGWSKLMYDRWSNFNWFTTYVITPEYTKKSDNIINPYLVSMLNVNGKTYITSDKIIINKVRADIELMNFGGELGSFNDVYISPIVRKYGNESDQIASWLPMNLNNDDIFIKNRIVNKDNITETKTTYEVFFNEDYSQMAINKASSKIKNYNTYFNKFARIIWVSGDSLVLNDFKDYFNWFTTYMITPEYTSNWNQNNFIEELFNNESFEVAYGYRDYYIGKINEIVTWSQYWHFLKVSVDKNLNGKFIDALNNYNNLSENNWENLKKYNWVYYVWWDSVQNDTNYKLAGAWSINPINKWDDFYINNVLIRENVTQKITYKIYVSNNLEHIAVDKIYSATRYNQIKAIPK